MPNFIDMYRKCRKLYSMEVSPFGWIGNPITVEYGLALINIYDPQTSVCMRVKGVKGHVWAAYEHIINIESRGDYAGYFTKLLENFRIEFLGWVHTKIYWDLEWFKEYYGLFKDKFYDFSEDESREFQDLNTVQFQIPTDPPDDRV